MRAVSRDAVRPSTEGVDNDGNWYRITNYFGAIRVADTSGNVSDEPVGFLAETGPDAAGTGDRFEVVPPHFHLVRQFQVFVGGDEPHLGKRRLSAFDFHYVDPSTPYGPFVSGRGGITFFTLRPRRAPGGVYWMPGSRARMTQRAARNIVLSLDGAADGTLIEPHEDGLAAFLVSAGPDEPVVAPEPARSGGQYLLVTAGSFVHEGVDHPPLSLVWVDPEDGPAMLAAGPNGVTLLVLQFPLPDPAAEPTAVAS